MNVTELARQLKVTTDEMLEKLPDLGFDIGKRAIKVDDRIAQQIVGAWKAEEKKQRKMSEIAKIRGQVEEKEEVVQVDVPEINIAASITVREFAGLMSLPISQVLGELMKNGIFISMNERIDFDTASIIGENLGFKVMGSEESQQKDENESLLSQNKLKAILTDKDNCLQVRPPVIVVMGHVDHGKTKILDAIRQADVVAGESGGITQHIGAYQVHKNDRVLTFIDTPGHEAFTAMRSRGARVADLAILVIAADDGVQPQTKEAIRIIKDAGLPFVVAINKIDKPEANVEKVKQELATIGLQPEDWGGNVICALVSAIEGTGIDDLLETLLLMSDLDKDMLQTNAQRLAIGTIIDSNVDKGEGPVATLLIQSGTLKIGDQLSVGDYYYGKVRSLKDYTGKSVLSACPGEPVKILGLKIAPEVGSIMEAVEDVKKLNKNFRSQRSKQEKDFSVQGKTISDDEGSATIKNLNFIIKADVLGSLEAIIESLAKLETKEIKIKVISKGLGNISETDILKAEVTGATVLGFHVTPHSTVASLARDKNVDIKYYEVIYHLTEEVQKEMEKLKEVEVVKKLVGKLEILKIFRRDAAGMIIGGRVVEGMIVASDTVIVVRDGEPITSGQVNRLESGKQQVDKVSAGQECGVNFKGDALIEERDILEFYQTENK